MLYLTFRLLLYLKGRLRFANGSRTVYPRISIISLVIGSIILVSQVPRNRLVVFIVYIPFFSYVYLPITVRSRVIYVYFPLFPLTKGGVLAILTFRFLFLFTSLGYTRLGGRFRGSRILGCLPILGRLVRRVRSTRYIVGAAIVCRVSLRTPGS